MKLSAAIEDALITKKYNFWNEFMCHVLRDKYSQKLEDELNIHLKNIFPQYTNGPLVNLLHNAEMQKPKFDERKFWDSSFQRTTEWYVWFVFDLKRKGL